MGGDEIREAQRVAWARPGENPWTTIATQAIAAEAALAPPALSRPVVTRLPLHAGSHGQAPKRSTR